MPVEDRIEYLAIVAEQAFDAEATLEEVEEILIKEGVPAGRARDIVEARSAKVRAVNRWWAGIDNTGTLLTADDVAEIRASLGIPKTQRKPHQKKLFD